MNLKGIIYGLMVAGANLYSRTSGAPTAKGTALSTTNSSLDTYRPLDTPQGRLTGLKVQDVEASGRTFQQLDAMYEERVKEKAYREAMNGVRKPNYTQAAEIVGDSYLFKEQEHVVDKRTTSRYYGQVDCGDPFTEQYDHVLPVKKEGQPNRCYTVVASFTKDNYQQTCAQDGVLVSDQAWRRCAQSDGSLFSSSNPTCNVDRIFYTWNANPSPSWSDSFASWSSCRNTGAGAPTGSNNECNGATREASPVAPLSPIAARLRFENSPEKYGVRLWTIPPGIGSYGEETWTEAHAMTGAQFAQLGYYSRLRCMDVKAELESDAARNNGCPTGQIRRTYTYNRLWPAPVAGSSTLIPTLTLNKCFAWGVTSCYEPTVAGNKYLAIVPSGNGNTCETVANVWTKANYNAYCARDALMTTTSALVYAKNNDGSTSLTQGGNFLYAHRDTGNDWARWVTYIINCPRCQATYTTATGAPWDAHEARFIYEHEYNRLGATLWTGWRPDGYSFSDIVSQMSTAQFNAISTYARARCNDLRVEIETETASQGCPQGQRSNFYIYHKQFETGTFTARTRCYTPPVWGNSNCVLPSEANKYGRIVPTGAISDPCNYVEDVWTKQNYNETCTKPMLLASMPSTRQCLDSTGNLSPQTRDCRTERFSYGVSQDVTGVGASHNSWASCRNILNSDPTINPICTQPALTKESNAPYTPDVARSLYSIYNNESTVGVRLWATSPGIRASDIDDTTISNEHFEILRQLAQRRCNDLTRERESDLIRNNGCPTGQKIERYVTTREFDPSYTFTFNRCVNDTNTVTELLPTSTQISTSSSSALIPTLTPTPTPYYEEGTILPTIPEQDGFDVDVGVGIGVGSGVGGGLVLGAGVVGIAGLAYYLKKKREEGHYEVTEAVPYEVAPPLARPEASPVDIIELREEDEDEPAPPPLPARSSSVSKDLNYVGIDVGEDEEKPHESPYEPVGESVEAEDLRYVAPPELLAVDVVSIQHLPVIEAESVL